MASWKLLLVIPSSSVRLLNPKSIVYKKGHYFQNVTEIQGYSHRGNTTDAMSMKKLWGNVHGLIIFLRIKGGYVIYFKTLVFHQSGYTNIEKRIENTTHSRVIFDAM